jgi:hypothetical protein
MIKILKILTLIFLISNTSYSQDTSFISSIGTNIHDAQRKAMNAIRTHKLKVMSQHTEISSDGTAIVVIQVKHKKVNKADIYAEDDRP